MYPCSTGVFESCPHECSHSIYEHVDTWAICVIILPPLLNFNYDRMQLVLQHRRELWTTMALPISITEYLRLLSELIARTLPHTFSSIQSWIIWCNVEDCGDLTWRALTTSLAQTLNVSMRRRRAILSQTFNWIQLLQSRDVRPYYDDVEQIGLKANRAIDRGILLDTGPTLMRYIGNRSMVLRELGLRTSTVDGYYFGSGASLLNHACCKCANVIIDYEHGEVEATKNILEGQALRVVYNQDNGTLLHDYAIVCHCTIMQGDVIYKKYSQDFLIKSSDKYRIYTFFYFIFQDHLALPQSRFLTRILI